MYFQISGTSVFEINLEMLSKISIVFPFSTFKSMHQSKGTPKILHQKLGEPTGCTFTFTLVSESVLTRKFLSLSTCISMGENGKE